MITVMAVIILHSALHLIHSLRDWGLNHKTVDLTLTRYPLSFIRILRIFIKTLSLFYSKNLKLINIKKRNPEFFFQSYT